MYLVDYVGNQPRILEYYQKVIQYLNLITLLLTVYIFSPVSRSRASVALHNETNPICVRQGAFSFKEKQQSHYLPRHPLYCLVSISFYSFLSGFFSISDELDPMHLTVLNLRSFIKIRHTIPFGLSQGPHSPDRFLMTSSWVRLPVQQLVAVHNFLHKVGFASTYSKPPSIIASPLPLWLLCGQSAGPDAHKLHTSAD